MNVLNTPVELILVGARGQVGSALRRRLGRELPRLRADAGLDLRRVAACDRRGFAFDGAGLALAELEPVLRAREPGDLERVFERGAGAPMLLVDCTASDDIADRYLPLLARGIGVVGANKRANSRCFASWQELQRTAREQRAPYRYETTAGAAIPLLGPLRDLRLRGERVLGLRGVLSGSLSYLLHRLHEGCAFSAAVEEARQLGYTEPDPLDDRLLVLGEVDAGGARIRVRAVPAASDFGRLLPGQNLVCVRTELQDSTPLSLGGPGAGAEVTAAGLLSDVVAAATELAARTGRG